MSVHYDLILTDGRLLMDVPTETEAKVCRDAHIAHRLKLDPLHRLPFVGLVLRNFWAKRKGAILCEIPKPHT